MSYTKHDNIITITRSKCQKLSANDMCYIIKLVMNQNFILKFDKSRKKDKFVNWKDEQNKQFLVIKGLVCPQFLLLFALYKKCDIFTLILNGQDYDVKNCNNSLDNFCNNFFLSIIIVVIFIFLYTNFLKFSDPST